jgi:hypothetical protein
MLSPNVTRVTERILVLMHHVVERGNTWVARVTQVTFFARRSHTGSFARSAHHDGAVIVVTDVIEGPRSAELSQ